MPDRWQCISPEEAIKSLSSSPGGLREDDALARLKEHGPNELEEKGRLSPIVLFLKQFQDLMVVILIIAAVVSGLLAAFKGSTEEWLDMGVIVVIVIVNAAFGFAQEYKAERTIQALRDMASPKATVIRGGVERQIPSRELVPGDVMLLSTGDSISADGRLLQSFNLKVNEASLTGESLPVEKTVECLAEEAEIDESINMVYSGCSVEYGRGKAVVTATGMDTEIGRIAGLLEEDSDETPLQKKLTTLGKQLGIVVLGTCAFIFAVGLLRSVAAEDMFLTAVSLAVAAIPEGLPAIVTISLALGLQRMAKRNAVVRRLPAVESLGSATVICTDKTGTLTKGEMNITEIHTEKKVRVTGEGFEPEGGFLSEGEKIEPMRSLPLGWLLRTGVLCNDASLYQEGGRWRVRGDTTEGALLVTARKADLDGGLRQEWARVFEIPFDSKFKRMITVNEHQGKRFAFLKGATESVLPLCERVLTESGTIPLAGEERDIIRDRNDEMAGRALRVLALAYRELNDSSLTEDNLAKEFVFLGLAGMIDAPRKEAVEAIAKCKRAGIRVMMITGDHELTAKTIAIEMGICPSECELLDGRSLTSMSEPELTEKVRTVSVFARVNPEHKMRIVDALQHNGEIVAMTGDGVNDAPALKRANIGVAMGVTGTDVAKEASDMVLVDDNFASIVNAVEEGRGIYDNIRRFVSFLLACNAGEVIAMFLAIILFTDPQALPLLLPIQILWMNLVTDGLPALALGLEPTPPDIMDRPPNDPKEPPVTRRSAYRVLAMGGVFALATLLSFLLVQQQAEIAGQGHEQAVETARTAAFCTIVLSQLLFALSARSDRHTLHRLGIATNKKLLAAVLVSFSLQLLVVYGPGLGGPFGTVPLGWEVWGLVLPLSILALIVHESWKMLENRRGIKE